jgi:hypothetical protein
MIITVSSFGERLRRVRSTQRRLFLIENAEVCLCVDRYLVTGLVSSGR